MMALEEVIRAHMAIRAVPCPCGGAIGCEICSGGGSLFPGRYDADLVVNVLGDILCAALLFLPEHGAPESKKLLRAGKKFLLERQGALFEDGIRRAIEMGNLREEVDQMESNAQMIEDPEMRDVMLLIARAMRECDGTWDDFLRRRKALTGEP